MQRAVSKLPCAATTASQGSPAWCSRLSMFCPGAGGGWAGWVRVGCGSKGVNGGAEGRLHAMHNTARRPARPTAPAAAPPVAHLREAAQQQAFVVQQAHEVVGGGGQKVAGEQLLHPTRRLQRSKLWKM